MRRRYAVLILIPVLVGAGWLTLRLFGIRTREALEEWSGRQCLAIANTYLRPQLAWTSLRYEAPATVILSGVTLTDDGVPVVEARTIRLTLAEVPRTGRPIVIKAIDLIEPNLLLRELEDGRLLGFNNIVKSEPGDTPESEGTSRPPSEIFVIRRLAVTDGIVTYEQPGSEAMRFDDISFTLHNAPGTVAGGYDLDVTLERAPLLEMDVKGSMNIDTGVLSLDEARLTLGLTAENRQHFPPDLQNVIRQHDIRGSLAVTVAGDLPLTDPNAGRLLVNATLDDALLTSSEYVWPVERIDLQARLRERTWYLERADLHDGDGLVAITGIVAMDAHTFEADIVARDMLLQNILVPPAEGPPRFAGRTSLTGHVAGSFDDLLGSLVGTGDVAIRDGRLVGLPIFGDLVKIAGGRMTETGNDKGDAHLEVGKGTVRARDIRLVGGAIAARGEGEIGFGGAVNFRFNAGPLERIQHSLGAVGDIFAFVTDQFVTYQVEGTLDDSAFNVRPLGLGTKK